MVDCGFNRSILVQADRTLYEHFNLFVGEHPSGALGKKRTSCSSLALGDDFADCGVIRDGR
jgi:hypothetical protein